MCSSDYWPWTCLVVLPINYDSLKRITMKYCFGQHQASPWVLTETQLEAEWISFGSSHSSNTKLEAFQFWASIPFISLFFLRVSWNFLSPVVLNQANCNVLISLLLCPYILLRAYWLYLSRDHFRGWWTLCFCNCIILRSFSANTRWQLWWGAMEGSPWPLLYHRIIVYNDVFMWSWGKFWTFDTVCKWLYCCTKYLY